jgi:glycerol-3-phosphate acyltransferase PlsY
MLPLILTAVLAYLLGSVSFGLLMARLFRLGDLRQLGSGNIGATNVLRSGNRLAALLTLLGDAGKGAAAVLLARWLTGDEAAAGVAALFAMAGHLWSCFAGFRGGKGVATFLGTLLALAWPVGLAACGTWLATALLARISSLAALVAAALAPLYAGVFYHWHGAALIGAMSLLVFFKHAPNIRRLLDGTEPRIGKKS